MCCNYGFVVSLLYTKLRFPAQPLPPPRPFHHPQRQIYASADEDTRRAMNKSYQESGGKVLSTNWKEVAQKKVTADEDKKEGK